VVFREGQNFASKYLVIYIRPNELSFCRLGLSVSKRVGTAVTRNRLKRLLREAVRSLLQEFPFHYDFIIVARKSSVDGRLDDFIRDIRKFLSRLKYENNSYISDKAL